MVRVFEGSLGIFSVLVEGGLPVCVSVVKANSIPLFYTFSHKSLSMWKICQLLGRIGRGYGFAAWEGTTLGGLFISKLYPNIYLFPKGMVVRPLSFL